MKKHLNPFAAGRLALAVSLAILPSALPAQAVPSPSAGTTSLRFAKSDAILGGQSSHLAAVIARQSGAGGAVAAPLLRHAALTRGSYAPFASRAPYAAAPVAADRPDVFGSVALPVSRTPLDGRWRKVERAPVTGSAARFAAGLRPQDALARVDAVNRFVNAKVRFIDDSRQFRSADYWSPAAATLSRGSGDCEDYAIAKLQMLRAAGIADRDLYLVIVKDLARRADHAVLVVRAAGQLLLLDNGTNRIVDATQVRDYRPVLSYAAAGKAWTHGYRRPSPGYGAPVLAARASLAAERL